MINMVNFPGVNHSINARNKTQPAKIINFSGNSPNDIEDALEKNDAEKLREILKNSATDPNSIPKGCHRPMLITAIQKNAFDCVEEILKHPDIDPNITTKGLSSAISEAIIAIPRDPELKCLKALLAHPKTDPNLEDINDTPLEYARFLESRIPAHAAKYQKCIEELLKHPNIKDTGGSSRYNNYTANVNKAHQNALSSARSGNDTTSYDTTLKRTTPGKNDPKDFNDIGGMFDVKKELLKSIVLPWKPEIKQKLEENKIDMPNGILMYGPPGCGKTYIMKAVSAESKLPLYILNLADVGSQYIHSTSKNIKAIFDQLKEKFSKTQEPSILFMDEIDSMAANRGSLGENSDYKKEEVNTLLNLLNDASNNGIIAVGATNRIEDVDDAIKRTGRFDKHIYVGTPDFEARKDMLKKLCSKMPIVKPIAESEETVNKLSELLDGFSNSDIRFLVNDTARKAIFDGKDTISLDDLKNNIESFAARKSKEEIKKQEIGFKQEKETEN